MNVLVIGSGGREHALAWKLAQSPRVQRVYVAPGNGGTALDKRLANVPITDIDELLAFARQERIGLTVVGPEAPLSQGVVDRFRAAGLRIFGPTQSAARLESSKAFAKAFMQRHGIPTASSRTFEQADDAHAFVQAQGAPIVVKADGLAAGKGVVVATTLDEAHAAIDHMLQPNGSGVTHNERPCVVIEAFMPGEEATFIVLCDGKRALPLATSQDHKRIGTGDVGANTGGMGAYSPAPVVTPNVHARVMKEIIQPTLAGMAKEGNPFTGFLYAGLMIGTDGLPRVVEFNTRLGDPEAQVLLMRLKSDLFSLLERAADGRLEGVEPQWDRRVALGVVMAAAGYPETPRTGDRINGLPKVSDGDADAAAMVFHAGTQSSAGQTLTSGGRVLCVTALGDSIRAAQQKAYEAVSGIHFAGAQWRTDIGHRAIKR